MSSEQFSPQFLSEMIEHLDTSIQELERQERRIAGSLGILRVEEIREYWEQTLTPEEEWEFKRSMDYRDRELVWVWSRLGRAVASRVSAGQAYMRHFSPSARNNAQHEQS